MTIETDKAAARTAAFQRRKVAHAALRGTGTAGHLSALLAGFRGVPVAGFMPIRTEIDPLPAMAEAAAHGLVAVPVIEAAGQPLRFRQWTPDAPMVPGPFGARVPATGDWITPEIVILPLVAFDASGGRLGYGGGFYDRTLEGLRARGAVLAAGFAYADQQAERLPLEPTDQPLDMIVTERGIVTFTG